MAQNKSQTAGDLSQTAHQWLTDVGINVNENYCKEEITAHPDYPALTSLTDFLESGGMEYEAVQADGSYINEFRYPLLAHIKQPGNEYLHPVKDVTSWDKQKEITKDWSGIALYPAENATWHNEENDEKQDQALKNRITGTAFAMAGVLLFTAPAFIYPYILINLFGFLSLAGLAISIAALGTELGYQSKLVKEVCGTVCKGGCEKVLKSKFAKGIAGITPADASVIYFAAQFIFYMIGCFYMPDFAAIFAIALPGIAVAVWSIYTQAVKLKEWCALCLGIAAVLFFQASLSGWYFTNTHIALTFSSFFLFGLLAILLTLLFMPVKKLIKTNSNLKQETNAFKKWKTDASLFLAQWEKEPTCDNTIWGNDLILGNANAPIRITVACNPYCGPCAKAHVELDKLVEKYGDKVCVQVRLLCIATNIEDKKTIAVNAILQQAEIIKSKNELKEMLSDWFEWMDYEKWKMKWKINNELNVSDFIMKHETWMEETAIAHTPTFFINGKKLPGRYEIKDLDKMIPQMTETLMVKLK